MSAIRAARSPCVIVKGYAWRGGRLCACVTLASFLLFSLSLGSRSTTVTSAVSFSTAGKQLGFTVGGLCVFLKPRGSHSLYVRVYFEEREAYYVAEVAPYVIFI